MSTEDTQAPRLIDPGEDGWAPEPKVTKAEFALYGPLAGVIRLLGQASVAAQEAYSLSCKRANEDYRSCVSDEAQANSDALHSPVINAAWEFYRHAERTHQRVAADALRAHSEATEHHGEPVDQGEIVITDDPAGVLAGASATTA